MIEYSLSSKAHVAYIVTLLERITKEKQNSIISELNKQGF